MGAGGDGSAAEMNGAELRLVVLLRGTYRAFCCPYGWIGD